ncbi:MAG TPA: AAA family ATPase [Myxococcales bacterium]|jgi:ATP-dependent Clp protease ATP-binding subunit ClpC
MPTAPATPQPLEIATPLLCQELWGGGFLVAPVANSELACRGDTLAACLAEQRLFLEEYLAAAEPGVVARYAVPSSAKLVDLEIDAPRADLPKRLAIPGSISLTCVAVSFKEESWAFLPTLGHAVRIEAKADLVEVVKAEAERLIAALELSPSDWLRLLPPRSQSLEWITLRLRRPDLDTVDKARAARKKAVKEKRSAEAVEILSSVAAGLHLRPEAKSAPKLVGRDRELAELSSLLGAKERTPLLLVGPELCGKTALLYAWLRQERAEGRQRQVWATSASRLMAGMSGLGQWQERVRRVVEAAAELDAVLWFENVADLLAQHASESLDVAGALKPALQEGKVRFAGEISPDSLDLLEARHAGFLSALSRLRVEPLSAKATTEVLSQRVAFFAHSEPDLPNLVPAAVPRLVELVERYLPYRAFPGKAVRLLDELRAAHRGERTPSGPRPLDSGDVYRMFSLKTGVPEFLLREDRALVAGEVTAAFQKQLVGQGEAVRRVVEALCEVKAGLQPIGKPLATFLFVGPTGVGKTELARQLASFLFGSPDRLFRFDMSEFADPYAAARLFQGNDRSEGLLTRRLRQQPFCVLLLDEIEKAHPAVFDLLLQVLGEGRLTDARGRTAFFQNALVVLTSNLGASHRRGALGIGAAPEADERHYRREVEKAFRPELVNRIDHIVPFSSLGVEEARAVTRLVVDKLRGRRGLSGAGVGLEVDDAVVDSLARSGYEPVYGARALRRGVEDRLVAPLAQALSEARGMATSAHVETAGEGGSGGINVQIEKVVVGGAYGTLAPLRAMQERRRFADRILAMESIEQMREQIALIVSQLSRADGRTKASQELAATYKTLRGDHQRMAALLREADELRGGLEAAEELSMLAWFAQENFEPFVAESNTLARRLRRLGPSLILGMEPRRDAITLVLQETDDARALDVWLLPLLAEAKSRRWTIEGRPGMSYDKAKRRRRWSAVAEPQALAKRLAAKDRDFREVLLHVSGPQAGMLLALEAGLHRFRKISPKSDPAHLWVVPVAMRSSVSESELDSGLLQPASPVPAKQLGLMSAVRVRGEEGQVQICTKDLVREFTAESYWKDFEEVALEHLMHHEQKGGFDREGTYRSPLDLVPRKQ